jgi:formate hydrogenlyase subunit 3/multisubunit Na+/H+ antiporter MnhD subunit
MSDQDSVNLNLLDNNYVITGVVFTLSVITISIAYFFTSKRESDIREDVDSKTRIEEINENMTEYMGRVWPMVILTFYIFVAMMLYLLRECLQKTELKTVELDATKLKMGTWLVIILGVIFGIWTVTTAYTSYLNDIEINGRDDAEEIKKKRKEYVAISGLITLTLFVLVFGTRWLYVKYKEL